MPLDIVHLLILTAFPVRSNSFFFFLKDTPPPKFSPFPSPPLSRFVPAAPTGDCCGEQAVRRGRWTVEREQCQRLPQPAARVRMAQGSPRRREGRPCFGRRQCPEIGRAHV